MDPVSGRARVVVRRTAVNSVENAEEQNRFKMTGFFNVPLTLFDFLCKISGVSFL
jgi:hypothetical protein